jgi:CubicO group peptidase (beta-lactamase class C family)
MKLRSALGFCLILAALQGFAQQADKAAKIRDLLRSTNIPGIQLIYIRAGYTEAYNLGVVACGSVIPVNSATILEAASLSKAVFAYTVLRLADQGVLALDTPLLHYLGGRYERFDPANPAYGRITARMLLRHTAGFRSWADPGRIPLLFPPDSCFNYSGEGYMFLLAVLQRITRKDLQQLAAEETFKLLGMKNSSYRWKPAFASISSFGSDSASIAGHRTAHIGWGLGMGIQYNEKGKALWQWGDNRDFKAFYTVLPGRREQLVYFIHGPRAFI